MCVSFIHCYRTDYGKNSTSLLVYSCGGQNLRYVYRTGFLLADEVELLFLSFLDLEFTFHSLEVLPPNVYFFKVMLTYLDVYTGIHLIQVRG